MTKEQDILVLHGAEAHEVLEEWEDEFAQKTFESKLTILSRLQQEKDEDLEMQEWLVHSAKKKNKINASFLTDSATRKEINICFLWLYHKYSHLNHSQTAIP